MTIADHITNRMEENKAKYICMSSVWDVYNSSIGQEKTSNVYKDVKKAFESKKKVLRITAIVGAKGRSAHSPSQVLLFDTTAMTAEEEKEAGFFYQCDEFYSHNFIGGPVKFVQK